MRAARSDQRWRFCSLSTGVPYQSSPLSLWLQSCFVRLLGPPPHPCLSLWLVVAAAAGWGACLASRAASTRKPATAASLPRRLCGKLVSGGCSLGGAAVSTAASADEGREAGISWRPPTAVVSPGLSRRSCPTILLRARTHSSLVKRPVGGAGQQLPFPEQRRAWHRP